MESIIYILLPVHNRKNITLRFVRHLQEQDYKNYRLVLIDDGSSDNTAGEVLQLIPAAKTIRGNGNWWWAGCLQKGYTWLREQRLNDNDAVLIINDDSAFQPGFLHKGLEEVLKHDQSLVLATAYDAHTHEIADTGVFFDFRENKIYSHKNHTGKINCLSTRGLFLRVKDFVQLGGFHPFLLPHYLSDYEFTIRAGRKGYRLLCSPELKLWFDSKATGVHGQLNFSGFGNFFNSYFSKRYSENPVYLFNFILLVFPFPYNMIHSYRLLKSTLWILYKAAKNNFRLKSS